MALRRPRPEGFTEDLDLWAQLEAEKAQLQNRIDDIVIRLTVEKSSPTAEIAERFRVSAAAVSAKRDAALKRRDQRQRQSAA